MTGRRWETIAEAKSPGVRLAQKLSMLALAVLLFCGLAGTTFANEAKASPKGATLGQMSVGAQGDLVKLTFAASGKIVHHLSVSETPPGAVLRIENAAFEGVAQKAVIDDGLIDSVEFSSIGDDAVVSIKLAKAVDVEASLGEKELVLLVGAPFKQKQKAVETAKAEPSPAAPVVAPAAAPEFKVNRSEGEIAFVLGQPPARIDSFLLSDGVRLVVDLKNVTIPNGQFVEDYADGEIAKVAMRQSGSDARLVVEGRGEGRFEGYVVESTVDGFLVKIARKTAAGKTSEAAGRTVAAAVESKPVKGGGVLNDLAFRQDAEKSYVEIGLSKEADYEVNQATDAKVVLDLKSTSLSKKFERALDASAFKGPVAIIAAYARGADTRILVELKKAAPFKIEKTEKGLVIAFEGGSEATEAEKKVQEEQEKIVLLTPEGTPVAEAKAAEEKARQKAEEAQKDPAVKKGYTGQRISMDFVEADIRNILRIIGEISGLNIVTGSEVSGKMTIRLVDIPWDQALDVILKAKGLDKEIDGNVMRIVAAEKLAQERNAKIAQDLAAIKAKEDTTPLASDILPVSYASAKDVVENVKSVLSKRGTVTIDQRTNMILLRDLPDNIELARTMVAKLDTPTPQVLIEARIVEVSSTYSKELGIQWGGAFSADPARGNAPTNGFPNSIGLQGATGLSNYAVNLPIAAGSGGSAGSALSLSLGSINDVISLDMRIAAMESSGRGRVVSSPRVATLDNKAAEISQGISIPFTTATQEKIETQSIDYLLKLMVTPHVTSDDSIVLKIDLKKDSPSTTFVAVDSATPAKETRAATTEVLVRNGETAVIGGIITDSDSNTERGVPWFQKLPLIGWMFQSKTNRVDKTELIIFITPRVMRLDGARQASAK